MKRPVIARGALIALVGLCKLLPGCTEDCEGPMPSDTLSHYSEVVPKGTPAIRCRVVTRCADAYALNGKYSETLPNHFKIRDRGSGLANQKACTRRWRDGTSPPLECVDVMDFVPICAEGSGSDSPSPGGDDVIVTVGAGPTSGDYFNPAPKDEGAGEAPEQEGAGPGAGEI
jgi:hypothetical protein